MKTAVSTLSIAFLCLAASAHSPSDDRLHLGRRDCDAAPQAAAVPEVVPTVALVLMSIASLTVLAAYLRGKRSRV